MSNGNGHHWSKFAWRDWTNDAALRDCSLAAKGFWIGILALMHEGTPVGHLTINGVAATTRQMASSVNCTVRQAERALAELEAARVFSRTDDGTIYSRRMVKDAAAAETAREWGKAGGNPRLKPNGAETATPRPKVPPPEPADRVNPPDNPRAYRPPNPPPLTPRLTGGLNLESESEKEQEKEKKVSVFNNLPSNSTVPARAEMADETHAVAVRQLQADALQALMNEAGIAKPSTEPADKRATNTVANGPTKAHINRVAKACAMQIPRDAIRSPAEQIERIEAQPQVADAAGLKWRPHAPVQTPAEQLAALLGIPLPEAAARFQAAPP